MLAACVPGAEPPPPVNTATPPARDTLDLPAPDTLSVPRPVRRPPVAEAGPEAEVKAALIALGCVLDSPAREAQVLAATGLSARQLATALDRLREAGELDGSGTGGVRLTAPPCGPA